MSAALSTAFQSFPAKRLARASGAHPKTTQRWRDGSATPSGEALVRMMQDDDIFAAILRAAGRADEAAKQRAIAILTGAES